MSDAQPLTARFGSTMVTLIGPPGAFLESAGEPDANAAAENELWRAIVVSSFRIGTDEPGATGSAQLMLMIDGEPELVVTIVVTIGGTFAYTAEGEGRPSMLTIGEVPLGAVVRVLELPSRSEAEAYLDWVRLHPGPITDLIDLTDLTLGVEADAATPHWQADREGPVAAPTPDMAPMEEESFEMPTIDDSGLERASRGPMRAAVGEDAGAAETRRVLAHALAEMPPSTNVGDVAEVKFTLSWLKLSPSPDVEFDDAEVLIDPELPVRVSIATRGYRLVRNGRRTRTLSLKSAAKDVVRFRVEAVTLGRAEVTLVVRQLHELPLATLRLTSEIVAAGAPLAGVVGASADALPPDPTLTALPTLRIDESIVGGESALEIAVQIGNEHESSRTRIIDKQGLIADVYEQISALRRDLKAMKDAGDPPEARKRFGLEKLRQRGVDLSRRLFSPRMRQFLWDHRSELDGLVIQTTGEFDIPWEIVYVSDPTRPVNSEPEVVVDQFLGMRGATRWVYNTAMPTSVKVRRGHAKYLCPVYTAPGMSLSFTRREGEFVRGVFRARVVRPGNADAVSNVVTSGFDLLHFGGHGVWTESPPDQRLLLARYRKAHPVRPDSSYSAADLRRDLPDKAMVDPATPSPMVFLNACDVGRLDTSVSGLGGFPEAFLRGGVGVLLGCSWAVDDEIAGEFSQRFYSALEFSDIAHAMMQARSEALARADLSALAYVAYAHPHARVIVV